MKKKLILAATMLLCLATMAMAQNPGQKTQCNPEEFMQKKAETIAAKLLLSDADAAKFVPVYVSYLKDVKATNQKYRSNFKKGENGNAAPKTDAEIEASLRAQFDKSQEILNLRKDYFEKYLKVLSVKQVRELYKLEQEQLHHRYGKPQEQNGNRHGHPGR